MTPTRFAAVAVFATVAVLSTSAIAAPDAVMNRDADVHETSDPDSDVVNEVEEGDEVETLECDTVRCKIKIPGPDGWVRKSYLLFYDDLGPVDAEVTLLPYGPDTCRNGYVWRDAIPGDHVCVTPERRQVAADENAIAGSRYDPAGAYGPNSCVAGFVWREAYAGDVVCVTPGRRSQVAQENAEGPSHRVLE
jgi:hypothetical protein